MHPKKILIAGASGYIGTLLIEKLLAEGHYCYCLVRNPDFFNYRNHPNIDTIQADLTQVKWIESLDSSIDIGYYLVHSLHSKNNFLEQESNQRTIF